jgi:hypothetical protein
MVSSHDSGKRGRRITVRLGGADHVLAEAQATELRDGLTRELGAPGALTDREAMVWSEEYGTQVRAGIPPAAAAVLAAVAVNTLRGIAQDAVAIEAHSRAMLVAMIGGGR